MTNTPTAGRSGREDVLIIGFIALNIVLALLMYQVPFLANIHNAATVLIGVAFASRRKFDWVTYTGAYIVGAEVVWRVCHATLSYESGKYSLVAVFGCGLLSMANLRPMTSAVLYFVLLVPSSMLTLFEYSGEAARQQLSFYMAGPLALTVATVFLSNVRLTRQQLPRVLIALLAPITGLAAITTFSTLTTANIVFNTESNFATSGGFGPNQVSSVLGLGVFAALFFALVIPCRLVLRLTITGVMLFCAVQSAMTFSRNGLYAAGLSAVCVAVFGLRLPGVWRRFVLGGLGLVLLGGLVILPRLNKFTNGMLEERFSQTQATGRDELVWDDLRIFREHPVFGVGPGGVRLFRTGITHWAAHTEFSRLLAEHGVFGLIALVLLVATAIIRCFKLRDAESRTLTAGLFAWAFLYMAVNAMRVAAPSFAFALAMMDISARPRRIVRIRMIQKAA
jgi:O-antigen ligase